MIQSVNLPPSAHPVYTVITSSVHTAAMYSHVQLSAANLQCTLQPTAAIYNHLHCSYTIQCTLQLFYPVHTAAILSSAHCSYTIQCTLQLFYPVHTAAILSSAHCSYTIQCTLQLYHPVHTAATLSGSNTIQYIQCTFEPPQGKPIPLLAYLQNSQQTLMVDCSSPYDEEDWLIVAVQMMKKTG